MHLVGKDMVVKFGVKFIFAVKLNMYLLISGAFPHRMYLASSLTTLLDYTNIYIYMYM